jgi:hypothetical protein
MGSEQAFSTWVASSGRNWRGDAHVLLYKDAPEWAATYAQERFGTNTFLLRSEQLSPRTPGASNRSRPDVQRPLARRIA